MFWSKKKPDGPKDIHDMNDEELLEKVEEVFENSRDKILERIHMMEMANQITDPNVRVVLKYLLENMK